MRRVLITPQTMPKARRFMRAVANVMQASVTDRYKPGELLFLYGLGGSDRLPIATKHMEEGGALVAFDIGYWDRHPSRRKFRASINGFHCPDLIMRGPSPDPRRWELSGLRFRSIKVDESAPILLVGNGRKSVAVGADGWSERKAQEIRRVFPGKKILYKPKPKQQPERGQFDAITTAPIDSVLPSVSLVVCRHSNVAVDACRWGVPVVCDDGAAAAIYPHDLERYEDQPSAETRLDFLHRIAWWQWSVQDLTRYNFRQWIKGQLRDL